MTSSPKQSISFHDSVWIASSLSLLEMTDLIVAPSLALARQPHRLVLDHLVDRILVITELDEHVAGMLADPRSRACDNSFIQRKARRWLRLPHLANGGLIDLGDQAARHHLLVMNDLRAAQDRRTGHVCSIEPLQPFGCGMLGDILLHLVDARGGIDASRARCSETLILGEIAIARGAAKSLPLRIRDRAAGEIAVTCLEHEIGP